MQGDRLGIWNSMMRRVLCVWLPQWPLQQWCATQPEGKNRPSDVLKDGAGVAVALYDRTARSALAIAYCSPAAQARSIRPGMPLAEATAVAADRKRPAACCYQRYDPLTGAVPWWPWQVGANVSVPSWDWKRPGIRKACF